MGRGGGRSCQHWLSPSQHRLCPCRHHVPSSRHRLNHSVSALVRFPHGPQDKESKVVLKMMKSQNVTTVTSLGGVQVAWQRAQPRGPSTDPGVLCAVSGRKASPPPTEVDKTRTPHSKCCRSKHPQNATVASVPT